MKKIFLISFSLLISVSFSKPAIVNSITPTQISVGNTAILTSSNSISFAYN